MANRKQRRRDAIVTEADLKAELERMLKNPRERLRLGRAALRGLRECLRLRHEQPHLRANARIHIGMLRWCAHYEQRGG